MDTQTNIAPDVPRLPDGELPISLDVLIRSMKRNPPLNNSTLIHWIKTGVDDPHGRTVRLEAYREGRLWITSIEAYYRFRAACNSQ